MPYGRADLRSSPRRGASPSVHRRRTMIAAGPNRRAQLPLARVPPDATSDVSVAGLVGRKAGAARTRPASNAPRSGHV